MVIETGIKTQDMASLQKAENRQICKDFRLNSRLKLTALNLFILIDKYPFGVPIFAAIL